MTSTDSTHASPRMAGPRMVVEAARLGGRAVGAVAGILEPLPQLPPGVRVRIRVRVGVGVP